jgi:hypothetical protein
MSNPTRSAAPRARPLARARARAGRRLEAARQLDYERHVALSLDDALEVFAPSGVLPTRSVAYTRGGDFWGLPPELAGFRERWKARHPGEPSGQRYAVESIDWSEPDRVRFVTRPTEWMETRAWQDELVARPGSFEVLRFGSASLACALPVFLVVHAVVVTADGRLVASKRSPTVYYHPNTWSVSLEEGVEAVDFCGDGDALRAASLRGVSEELAVPAASLAGAETELLGIAVERALAAPAPVVLVSVPLTASELTAHEPDPAEVSALSLIPLDASSLDRWMPSVEAWHPTSRYRLFKLLARLAGESEARTRLGILE